MQLNSVSQSLIDCLYSLSRVSAGVTVAFIAGVALGILRSQAPHWLKKNWLFNFFLDAPKFPPPIAWVPFVVLFIGIGELSGYVIVFIGAVSPIFTATYQGIEKIPRIIIWTARSLELSKTRYYFQVLFMSSLPQIMTGVRSGLSMGWMSVIAAEMIVGQAGLGYSIQLNRINMQYVSMAFDIALIGFIGFLLNQLMNSIEKYVLAWHDSAGNESGGARA